MTHEMSVGEYGETIFRIMVGYAPSPQIKTEKGKLGWESIREEAEPLVRQLIALNDKQKLTEDLTKYKIVNYFNERGKRILSAQEKIAKAQLILWKVNIEDLEVGDKIWLNSLGYDNLNMSPHIDSPLTVLAVTPSQVFIEYQNNGNLSYRITKDRKDKHLNILKAPKDFLDSEEKYMSREFWLEQAEKLGIETE